MEIFSKKSSIRILLFLYNNEYSISSKYMLGKALEINTNSLNECIEILKEKNLVNTLEKLDARNRIEVRLTKLGIIIAQSLEHIIKLLENSTEI
ncbi:MAG: hypothetical protein ACFE9S_10400 [Candidatus Hermodarchaeota archaeon]